VWWLHGARDRAEHAFADEADALIEQLPHARRVVAYSHPAPGDRGYDRVGRLSGEAVLDVGVPADADFYVCGPEGLMHEISASLVARGVAPDRISTEVFGPGESQTPGIAPAPKRAPHAPAGEAGGGPLVSFARSNLSVAWDAAFASLLELAEACDVPVRWSCRTGVCQECRTGLVGGRVAYRPDPLEPPGPGDVFICCSQPTEEVTLDL